MPRKHFGHYIGCDKPIDPPYLSFVVSMNEAPDGDSINSWEKVDVCNACAGWLTADDLHALVSVEDAEPEAAEAQS